MEGKAWWSRRSMQQRVIHTAQSKKAETAEREPKGGLPLVADCCSQSASPEGSPAFKIVLPAQKQAFQMSQWGHFRFKP